MEHFLAKVATLGIIGNLSVNAFALLAATLHYYFNVSSTAKPFRLLDYIKYLFPVSLVTNKWTRYDTVYYFTSKLTGFFIYPVVGMITASIAMFSQSILSFGFGQSPMMTLNWLSLAAFLVVGLLCRDFASFLLHMMQHRIPLLWEFHKVHHAPESLIPLTGHRIHPLEEVCNLAGDAFCLGVIIGVFGWITRQDFDSLIADSVGFYSLINMLTLSPLQHSHIDLRFGWLERIVLSPAHHHLHHSVERQHWDKNFSAIFPFWDALWSTLMAPPPINSYRTGLPDGASSNYMTLRGGYLTPIQLAVEKIRIDGTAGLRPGMIFNGSHGHELNRSGVAVSDRQQSP